MSAKKAARGSRKRVTFTTKVYMSTRGYLDFLHCPIGGGKFKAGDEVRVRVELLHRKARP